MELLERHFDIALETPDGIKKLRELILSLAMRGKLVKQDPNDQPASELLKEIEIEKQQLIKDGKIRNQEQLPLIKLDDIPFEIPKEWEWVRLQNYGTWKSGSTPSRSNRSFYGGAIPWVKSGEVKQGNIIETSETITDIALKSCSLSLNPVGAVLIAMYGANIGEIGVLEIEATTNQAVCACTTYQGIYNIFLFNMLQSLKSNFISQGAGAAQPNISREKIINTIVPLPPFSEQKRIVEKIDQLMSLCDKLEAERNERDKSKIKIHSTAMNRLLTAPDSTAFNSSWSFITKHFSELYSVTQNVDELKKAILQLAVMGKLVDQDVNDQPASELLKEIEVEKQKLVKEGKIKKQDLLSAIKQEEIPYILPKSWRWIKLGELLIKFGAGSTPLGGKRIYINNGIIFLRSQNVWDDGLRLNDVARINQSIHEKMAGTKVIGKDILLNITGASIGRSTVYPENHEEANVSQHVAILRAVDKRIVEYLHKVIISKYFQDMIMDKQVGVSREGLSMSKLKDFLIPIPPLTEQKRIIKKIDELLKFCNSLEQQIKDSTGKKSEILEVVLSRV